MNSDHFRNIIDNPVEIFLFLQHGRVHGMQEVQRHHIGLVIVPLALLVLRLGHESRLGLTGSALFCPAPFLVKFCLLTAILEFPGRVLLAHIISSRALVPMTGALTAILSIAVTYPLKGHWLRMLNRPKELPRRDFNKRIREI